MQNELNELSAKSTSSTAESASKAQTLSLDAPGVANKIAARILSEIDSYCEREYNDGHRTHLGASLIGRNCKRYLWYVFRWCRQPKFDGRKQRLFNRGHREEERFIEWLEGIGFKIWFEDYDSDPLYYCCESNSYHFNSEITEDEKKDGMLSRLAGKLDREDKEFRSHIARAKIQGLKFKQYRISDCKGHFGGSLDGIAMFPPGWGIDEPVLLEFKTSGTGHKFEKLKDNKMPIEKPDHYAQTSVYGKKYGFKFVLYLCINKNDDDLHVELAKLSESLGEQLIQKAEGVIFSQIPPPKLSETPTYHECRYCDMLTICHESAAIERNCRSCVNARPIENSEWWCDLHSPEANAAIPFEVIPTGCPSYKAIA